MRRIVLVLAVLLTTTMAMAATPSTASANARTYSCTTAAEAPTYKGWATLAYRGCTQPGTPQTMDCKALTAWSWTAAGWQRASLSECGDGSQVYAWPYAAGWTWIWTARTGWLAISSSSVHVRAGYNAGCFNC